jgi:voltage-gated potassium channel
MYWATVTMTTVGYGDVTPHTVLGRTIASFMMLLGWGILAVPTGIVTAEMTAQSLTLRARALEALRQCAACGSAGHEPDALVCKDCGAELPREFLQDTGAWNFVPAPGRAAVDAGMQLLGLYMASSG